MNWDLFSEGIWHPFGKYGGWKEQEILQDKTDQCKELGRALWSFKYRKPASFRFWREHLRESPFVICSGDGGADPADGRHRKMSTSNEDRDIPYQWFSEDRSKWERIDKVWPGVRVSKPKGKKSIASAFVLKRIHSTSAPPPFSIQSYNVGAKVGERGWQKGLPQFLRSEMLIKRGPKGKFPRTRLAAVLELQEPYFVWISPSKPQT